MIRMLVAALALIAVETDNTSLIMVSDQEGVLRTAHYGERISDPSEFLAADLFSDPYSESHTRSYPSVGGTFINQPALHVKYADGTHNTELVYKGHSVTSSDGATVTSIDLLDSVTSLEVRLVFTAYEKEDVILEHAEIRNGGKKEIQLLDYASSSMTIEAGKYLLTHFYGGWATEMNIDREILTHDTKVIESRRGTQATQCNNPSFMLSLDTDSFSENDGEVVAGTLAWSGNFRLSFEIDESGRLRVLGGINPFASSYPLASGATFVTPDMIWTRSSEGAGGASRNLHRWARKYGVYAGGTVNPTLLNSWEGAYFTFTTETLLGMIDDAADMGLEMFVLDDGWFGNKFPRNGDDAGLGDWDVNVSKIPEGIDYVASYAHSKGLKFGIWIEPEMVNPKSELALAHPDWVVQSPGREIPKARNQWVLDLSNPAVQDFVFGIFDKTMSLAPSIDYIKWDCNRTVASFGSKYLKKNQDRFYVDYCEGIYNVMRRIREKYPSVIVQCCSSGGGRVDYGALRWFNEIWTSDDTDAFQRAYIQYATNLIYPACVMGSHVSAVPNHQSGNVTPLKFRFDMACSGRLGMELQPKTLTPEERAVAERCIASYKEYRDLVFRGDVYRLASPYEGDYYSLMYVSEDRSRAVVFDYCLRYQNRAVGSHPLKLRGLDPSRKYRVKELNVDRSSWWGDGGAYSGEFLSSGAFAPSLLTTYSSGVFYLEAL